GHAVESTIKLPSTACSASTECSTTADGRERTLARMGRPRWAIWILVDALNHVWKILGLEYPLKRAAPIFRAVTQQSACPGPTKDSTPILDLISRLSGFH